MAFLVGRVRGSYNTEKDFQVAGSRAIETKLVRRPAPGLAPRAKPRGGLAPGVRATAPRRYRAAHRRWPLAFVLTALFAVAGCHHRRAGIPPASRIPSSQPAPRPGHWVEQGIASWYGVPYHGRHAADGEVYNMYKLVAAHRTLPFNSIVRVTDLQNNRQVVVRIIDRGPFVNNRIIDLSFAAARALDMVGPGVAPVRLELVSGSNPDAGDFTVQVGAFAVHANAVRLQQRLEPRWGAVFVQEYDSPKGMLYRVRVGAVQGEPAARRLALQLHRQDHFPQTFVVRLDR
jgi:rare lipoprotein A